MIEIARQAQLHAQQGGGAGGSGVDSPPKQVRFRPGGGAEVVLQAGPAQFGPNLGSAGGGSSDDIPTITGQIVMANDIKACSTSQQNGESMKGNLVLVERGDCMFIEKARCNKIIFV
jgi:mannosidase alpha-like ER degradation enhancer 3